MSCNSVGPPPSDASMVGSPTLILDRSMIVREATAAQTANASQRIRSGCLGPVVFMKGQSYAGFPDVLFAVVQNCRACNNKAMTVDGQTDEGLRARKQRVTREAIHRIAVQRALVAGPHNVTAAEISTEAGVSARTFFNYFPSKEDAMLGFHEDLPSDDELAEFAASEATDLLDELAQLIRNVFSASPTD